MHKLAKEQFLLIYIKNGIEVGNFKYYTMQLDPKMKSISEIDLRLTHVKMFQQTFLHVSISFLYCLYELPSTKEILPSLN